MYDYYPFGMLVPNRNYSVSDDYRYGFQGQEKDDNIKGIGNSYDFGARMYDSRIGRWFAPDAYEKKYASNSTYSFALDSPMTIIDIDGNDIVIIGNKEYRRHVEQTLRDLYHQSPSGRRIVMDLLKSDEVYLIVENPASDDLFSPESTSKADGYIIFNVKEDGLLPPSEGLGNKSLISTPITVLSHELKHAHDNLTGTTNNSEFVRLNNPLYKNPDFGDPDFGYGEPEYKVNKLRMDEVEAVSFENQVRSEIGLPLRTHYGGENVFQKKLSSKAYTFGSGSKKFSTPILQYNGKFNFTKFNVDNAVESFIKDIIDGNNWWHKVVSSKEESNINYEYRAKGSFPKLDNKKQSATRLSIKSKL